MKKGKLILSTLIISIVTMNIVFSQNVNWTDVQSGVITKGQFESYTAKDGSVYSIGDRVNFGSPSGTNGKFVTIQKIDIGGTIHIVGAEILNTSAEIKKIKISGSKRAGFKVWFQTKGFTFADNYWFNIEDAISTGEVKSKGMTSDEALTELKKAKDKLDLGLITEEEYEAKKLELSKFIK
jgi:hypothetical protein